MSDTRLASLLVVMAHPDDEVFHGGILAQLSERGVRVTLVCALTVSGDGRMSAEVRIRPLSELCHIAAETPGKHRDLR